jgi:hypothetical protein
MARLPLPKPIGGEFSGEQRSGEKIRQTTTGNDDGPQNLNTTFTMLQTFDLDGLSSPEADLTCHHEPLRHSSGVHETMRGSSLY